jgi:hypothetical protein
VLTFDPVEHIYRWNGKRLATVTEIISDAFNTYGSVPADVLAHAAAFGTAFHLMAKLYIAGRLNMDALDPQLIPYLNGFKKYLREQYSGYELSEMKVEVPACLPRLGLAGTPDLCASWRIDDWKTRPYNKKTDPLQDAAYDKLDGGNGNSKDHYIIEFMPDDYKQTKCNDKQAWPVFKALLDRHNMNAKTQTIITGWENRL